MTNPEWGIKRTCPSCSAHFYDLNKVPVTCPKCKHGFDPALLTRAKRKTVKRVTAEEKQAAASEALLAAARKASKAVKKDRDSEDNAESMVDLAEMEDVDDIENLQELSELEEMEETPINDDDADEEAIIEELNTGDKTLVENVEDEEARAMVQEIGEEDAKAEMKKTKKKKNK